MADPLSIYDRAFAGPPDPFRTVFGPVRIARRRREREPELTPEEQRSLLRSLGPAVISGLSYLGGAIDKPGAAVRGVLSGLSGGAWGGGLLNLIPFSGATGITDPQKRVYGRDLLERWGMLAPNRPGLDIGDVLGAGVEIPLDPVAWATFGASALTQAGQAAKRAGLLARAAEAAGKGVGPRVARMTLTPRTILKALPGAERKAGFEAWRAATSKLTPAASRRLLDETLGGLVGVAGYPTGPARWVFSPGGLKTARALDVAGERLRFSAPVRWGAALFRPAVKGAVTELGQRIAEPISAAEERAVAAARGQVIPEARRLHEMSLTRPQLVRMQEAIEEAPAFSHDLPGLPVAAEPTQQKFRAMLDEAIEGEHLRGIPTPDLDDVVEQMRWGMHRYTGQRLKYLPRQREMFATPYRGPGGSRPGWGVHPLDVGGFAKPREELFRGHAGGTAVMQEMSTDRRLSGLGRKVTRADIDYLLQTYGGRLKDLDRAEARRLAQRLADLDPRHAQLGIPMFSTDIPAVVLKRVEYSKRAQAAADVVYGILTDAAIHSDVAPSSAWSLPQALAKARLTWEGGEAAKARLVQQMAKAGKAVADVDDLKHWFVPKEYVADVTRVMKPFSSPEEISALGRALDSFTNWWRANVTTYWPAYLTRNQAGGLVMNWEVAGGSPFRAAARMIDMDRLVRTGKVPGALDYPIIKQLGITDADEASRKLADLMAAHNVIGPYKGQALEVAGQEASDLLAEIPGVRPFPGVLRTIREGIPGPGTWQPWRVRGVAGQTRDVFSLVAAGRRMNGYVEALNRGGLWLDLVKQGWDPAAASRRVDLAHVAYGNLTSFERRIARRAVPFYAFAAGQARFLADELLQRPGGRLAQTIRAAGALGERQPFVPDYLAQTLTVPIPPGTPLIGPEPGAGPRYTGSFGLMHEDPLEFLGGGRGLWRGGRGFLQELGSRLAPPFKMPLEWATGASLFQAGPRGGRMMEDLDPTLGRIMANISGRREPVRFPGAPLVEHLVGGLVPRPFTTLRTLTDPRKRLPGTPLPGPAALTNVLTGIRLYDLPPAAQDRLARQAVEERMRATGLARTFESTYLPRGALEDLSPAQRREAEQLLGLQRLLNRRAQERARGLTTEPLTTW